jgi:uncharacterized protein YjiS (DUF1127 family)
MSRSTETRFYTLPLANLPPISRLFVALGVTIANWEERRLTRRALARLDSHMLRDIGMSPVLRDRESRKVFWRG